MTDNNPEDEYVIPVSKECHIPSIEDLARREDWPEVRAELHAGLREWAMVRGIG